MKHTDFKPDYHKIAQAARLSNANTAWVNVWVGELSPIWLLLRQKRFKKIVEIGGFRLVGGAVVEPGGSDDAPATPSKAKAQTKKSAETPRPAKKRRMEEITESEAEWGDEVVERKVISKQENSGILCD